MLTDGDLSVPLAYGDTRKKLGPKNTSARVIRKESFLRTGKRMNETIRSEN